MGSNGFRTQTGTASQKYLLLNVPICLGCVYKLSSVALYLCISLSPRCAFNTDEWAARSRTHRHAEVGISPFSREPKRSKADGKKKKRVVTRKGSGRKRWMQRMEEKREKEERNRGPPKWLWSCIKLVMSVIRGKSAAEACSIRGEMVTLRPLLLFCHSSLIAPLCSLSRSSSKARLARLIRSSLPHSKPPDILNHRRCLHRDAGFPKTPCKLLALM